MAEAPARHDVGESISDERQFAVRPRPNRMVNLPAIDVLRFAITDQRMRLVRLALTDFRNYAAITWRPGARISVLFGPNGSGKTNLLEAVSLLMPGRGLRGSRNADFPRHGGSGGWAVAGRFATADGETDIGTGTSPMVPLTGGCSVWTAPRRAARRRSPPTSPRCG